MKNSVPWSDYLSEMECSSSYVTDEEGNMDWKDIHKMMQVIF